MKAFRTELFGVVSIVMARSRSAAKAATILSARAAGYTVHLGKGETLSGVRVHFFPGNWVMHFSLAEFNRVFKPEKDRR